MGPFLELLLLVLLVQADDKHICPKKELHDYRRTTEIPMKRSDAENCVDPSSCTRRIQRNECVTSRACLCPASEGECLCPESSCWSQGKCVPTCQMDTVFEYNVSKKRKPGQRREWKRVTKVLDLIPGPAILFTSPTVTRSTTETGISPSTESVGVSYAESGGNLQSVLVFVGAPLLIVATVGLVGVFWIRRRKDHSARPKSINFSNPAYDVGAELEHRPFMSQEWI